jgi:cytoskeletal protein RodZ
MNEQQETIATMLDMTAGEMLKNARTTGRRKREISTIAKLLCIKEEFLTALEEGNYRVIPEDVYILGFARSYAVELGLDPDEVILKLKKELGLIKEEQEDEEEPVSVVQKQPIKIDKEAILKWFKTSVNYVKKHWVWFASGFAALIIIIILSLLIFGGKSEPAVDTNATETVEVVATVKEPDFRYPIHEKFDTKNSKESRVVLQAEKESWVKIEDARGNSVFSRVLIPGDVYYLPASDKLKATFGNVGAIDVWVDGQLLKKLGPANTRKTGISMAPDALKSVGFAD